MNNIYFNVCNSHHSFQRTRTGERKRMNDSTKRCSVFSPIMRKLLPEILNIPVRPRLWSVFPGIILYLAFPRAKSLKPPRRELKAKWQYKK